MVSPYNTFKHDSAKMDPPLTTQRAVVLTAHGTQALSPTCGGSYADKVSKKILICDVEVSINHYHDVGQDYPAPIRPNPPKTSESSRQEEVHQLEASGRNGYTLDRP